ncbi:riboflavin synthase [Falsiroseomonas selenitidurans]|uniref:Riboflavin synthase n=1 Tax=Falsiroseomonas selenitidurans TaxID=2716335 RepID=A0ABX1E161_9PROT|nr:riboflavin synthase [Falsiroseomonas selenitidurans]NKC29272.1 riboflavin synthase [Falsiroseomonas selenitidurans]
MFTGIITAQGEVSALVPMGEGQDMRLTVAVPEGWLEGAVLGASIACSGCCLTAVALEPAAFTVEASAETLAKTTLGGWQVGRRINLERPLRMGDELGGHVVSGHVDGLGEVLSATPENGSTRWRFRVPAAIARFIAPKGSVAIDGVSLTVNEVEGHEFGVNIIPHTTEVTGFATLRPGDAVNIEIDMLARYVARLREFNA